MRRPLVSALTALLLAGCGDPIAEGDYRGEPLLTLEGRIEGDARTSTIHAPYIGIVWMVFDFYSGEGTGRAVTSVVPVPDASFPGEFHLALYERPPEEAFTELFGVRFAIGAIVALDDVDGDRRFSMDPYTGKIEGDDRFFGSSFWYQLLVYVDEVADADCARALWANPEALTVGAYQLAAMDECAFGYSLLPAETPIRLILFPLTEGLPEAPPNYVEPSCDDPGPYCEQHPDDPVCQSFEGSFTCQYEQCVGQTEEFDRCVNRYCLDAPDFGACAGEFCAAEAGAVNACLSERCSSTTLCLYF